MHRIGFVLGKPPARSPVLGTLVDRLRQRPDVRVDVAVPDGPGWAAPAWARDADLVAIRGLGDAALATLLPLEAAGVRFCDPPSAVLAARDRAACLATLAAAGIGVPAVRRAAGWAAVRARAGGADGPVVVKHARSEVGRGARVWIGPADALPPAAPFPGPYVIEEHVAGSPHLCKLYVVGEVVRAVALHDDDAHHVPVDTELERVAQRARSVLGLTVLGLDLLGAAGRRRVVDVNPFPSSRRLPDAVDLLSEHLLASARAPTRPASRR